MPCTVTEGEAAAWRDFKDALGMFNYLAEQKGDPRRFDAQKDYRLTTKWLHEELCAMLKSMEPEKRDRIVYNARDKRARRLADWWEYHQAQDARHEAERLEAIRIHELRASAAAKLTHEERAALGLKGRS